VVAVARLWSGLVILALVCAGYGAPPLWPSAHASVATNPHFSHYTAAHHVPDMPQLPSPSHDMAGHGSGLHCSLCGVLPIPPLGVSAVTVQPADWQAWARSVRDGVALAPPAPPPRALQILIPT
jgi:hypothetical protein